jgi:hypothetical protein
LWFNHRKCLLLTHSATLFSIFEADVRAADLRATGRFLTHLIGREVLKLRPATQDVRRPGAGKVILAKTADRSVLGCMNDMAFLCEKGDQRIWWPVMHRCRHAQPVASAQHQQRPRLPASDRAHREGPALDVGSASGGVITLRERHTLQRRVLEPPMGAGATTGGRLAAATPNGCSACLRWALCDPLAVGDI